MGNQFYYTNSSNEVTGPCTTLQLMALHKAGTLTDRSLVCPDGSSDWVELRSIYPAARLARMNKDSAEKSAASPPSTGGDAASAPAESPALRAPIAATWTQAAIIIGLLMLGLVIPHIGALRPVPKWEYKKVTFTAEGYDRIGAGALKYSSIRIDEHLLDMMGRDGWEMAGSHLEMETAFPNFGQEDRLTGLQPNIRPQSLTVLFKRPAR